MSDWLGWRKPPEEKPAPEGPVALAPIESIDVEAAYRARVGPVSRGILFIFRYFPLTATYSFFAAFVFAGAGVRWTLVGLGIAGDLLRRRYAPDLKLADREWVGLFCDGEWSAEAAQAYDHWYCGLEKPFLLLGIGYLVAMFFLELFVPVPAFAAYMDLFAPLHDWTREHLYIAAKHSADLIAHGYAHRVAFLVHLLMVGVFIAIVTPLLFCVGGNAWLTKIYIKSMAGKYAQFYMKRQKNSVIRYFPLRVLGTLLFFIFMILYLYNFKNVSWEKCLKHDLCPQYEYFSTLYYLIMFGIGGELFLSFLPFNSVVAKSWSIRFTQLSLGEKNNANR